MREFPRLSREVYRGFLSLSAGALLGSIWGVPLWGMVFAAIALLGWHLRQLYRLIEWASQHKPQEPPDLPGVWELLSASIYRMRQDNLQRKTRLGGMLKRFQESTSAMNDATLILNESGQIEWMNKATNRLLGLRRKKDVGQRLTNLIRIPEFVRFMNEENSGESMVMHSPVDKEITLDLQIVPFGDNLRLLTARDITRLRRLESMRRDFVANVSHELKTPVTVLSGYLESLIDSDHFVDQSASMRRALGSMYSQTQRMDRLIADLLFLSRLEHDDETQNKETLPVNMAVLLNDIVENTVELSGARKHSIELEMQPGLHLHGSKRELEAAFSNLMSNAVKYSEPGSPVQVCWRINDKVAELCVQDQGQGIPEQHISRLTERFYRVPGRNNPAENGTGLGLSIVKHVLRRHDAVLKIDSDVGLGSCFCCQFKRFHWQNPEENEMLQSESGEAEAL